MSLWPACGIYRTTRALSESLPAGQLVYFHDHGDPGPGLYLPNGWSNNRASFHAKGFPLTDPSEAASLQPLAPEGFYVVSASFTCCPKDCHTFAEGALLQLGYNTQAEPLLFIPEWRDGSLRLPEKGTRVDAQRLSKLVPCRVPGTDAGRGTPLH